MENEAKNKAFDKAVVYCAKLEDEGRGIMTVTRAMFDAGYAAASRWRSIEKDGLPSEGGKYLVQNKFTGEIEFQWFNPIAQGRIDQWKEYFIAWQPKPEPFTPEQGTED